MVLSDNKPLPEQILSMPNTSSPVPDVGYIYLV